MSVWDTHAPAQLIKSAKRGQTGLIIQKYKNIKPRTVADAHAMVCAHGHIQNI